MTIWIIFALMTAAAVMAVLWPLSRRPTRAEMADEIDPDTQFYRDQIAEIERDRERGLLSETEIEAARIEAGRRLLRSVGAADRRADAVGEPALRRRRAASALALSAVPLLGLTLYGAYGSPQLPDEPLSARLSVDPRHLDLAAALVRIETHLQQNPEDGRGWEVIAPVYLRGGRFDDAVKAYGAAIRLLGETAPRLASYGEAMVMAKEGVVSADAKTAFERAVELDPAMPKAHFYLAEAAEQDGDKDKARAEYQTLVAKAPPNAPYLALVQQRLARLDGKNDAATAVAALPPKEQMDTIRGMVGSLAARLESDGGSAEEWARLIRSYVVLGERDKAAAAWARARIALAQDETGLRQVSETARSAGLATGEGTP